MARLLSLLVLLTVLAAPLSAAQSNGVLAGIVVDASGAPVGGASVSVDVDGKPAATVETGPDGRFTLERAHRAGATVRVRANGFAEATAQVGAQPVSVRVVLHPRPLSESVTVTASRGARGVDTAASASILSSAELLTSAAGSIDDALRNTPGFSLFRRSSSRVANPTTQGVTLRGVSGSGASRTLVVADGWALNDPFGSWVYWNRIPIAAIDRVEVVRGASGDLYGADALGGVIQVLTLDADRPRLRALFDAGSQETLRSSAFGGRRLGKWLVSAGGEFQNTDGAYLIEEAVRGVVDVRADSDYRSGFASAGYDGGTWRATLRGHGASEDRGNGTPVQINDTSWRQVSADLNGAAAGGYWTARVSGGSQEYFQTFSAIAGGRATERLTSEQTIPSSFAAGGGQWVRTWRRADVLVGGEGRRTSADITETTYPLNGSPATTTRPDVSENNLSAYGRVRFVLRDDLSLIVGGRSDHWESTETSNFFSPRLSLSWRASEHASLQFSASRAYRTPTLNELYRPFRVGNILTNANASLEPERLTSIEGGVLFGAQRASVRVTAFHNTLDDAISNVTLTSTPALITRQRQNTDEVGSSGVEIEGDVRPHPRVTLNAFGAFMSSHFKDTPQQPALKGNRIPQVPRYHVGAGVIADAPRVATFSAQLRLVGAQFDDDLNELTLNDYAVVDVSATRPLTRSLQVFIGVENLFDSEYDVARTPLRSIGWPRSVRAGLRVFVP
jgi:outer membrane receptor protein involved in Fe transport